MNITSTGTVETYTSISLSQQTILLTMQPSTAASMATIQSEAPFVPSLQYGSILILAVAVMGGFIVAVRRRKSGTPTEPTVQPSREPRPIQPSPSTGPEENGRTLVSGVPDDSVASAPTEPLPHAAVTNGPLRSSLIPAEFVVSQPPVEKPPIASQALGPISTGYPELDQMLSGGLPERYAVLFASPSYDERELLISRIIGSNSSSGNPSFFVSGEMRKLEDLLNKYPNNFFAFCSQADESTPSRLNLFSVPRVENLSDFNISLTHLLRRIQVKEGARKVMVVDILSDVLLQHKLVMTRRWLSDFLTRRKTDGFTVLATFNPLIAAREEVQTIMDSFDGVIEIYEKELKERTRRFLTIKKMYGLRYSETELMLDKGKLY
jgi:KaiC/GvpD/RAD55 family RecA-like ATPase